MNEDAKSNPPTDLLLTAIRDVDEAGRLAPDHAVNVLTVDGRRVRPVPSHEDGYDELGISVVRSEQGFVKLREFESYRKRLIESIPTDEFYGRVKKAGENFESWFCWNPEDGAVQFSDHARRVRTHMRNQVGGSSNYWARQWYYNDPRYVWGPPPKFVVDSNPLEVVRDPETRYTLTSEGHALVFGESDGLFLDEVIAELKNALRLDMQDAGRPGWNDFGREVS